MIYYKDSLYIHDPDKIITVTRILVANKPNLKRPTQLCCNVKINIFVYFLLIQQYLRKLNYKIGSNKNKL